MIHRVRSPRRRGRNKVHWIAGERVGELDFPGVQAQGRIGGVGRLLRFKFLRGEIDWIAADGKSELPEMDADLLGASSDRKSFERRALGISFQNGELGA